MELPLMSHGKFNAQTWLLLLTCANFLSVSKAINCYTCSSHNGSQPWCEDPIDTSQAKFTEQCQVPKENHRGLFIANFCIKIVGKTAETGKRLVIRACAQTSMDNQCGEFEYEGVAMSGCVLTCNYNGCNDAPTTARAHLYVSLLLPTVGYFVFHALRLRNLCLKTV